MFRRVPRPPFSLSLSCLDALVLELTGSSSSLCGDEDAEFLPSAAHLLAASLNFAPLCVYRGCSCLFRIVTRTGQGPPRHQFFRALLSRFARTVDSTGTLGSHDTRQGTGQPSQRMRAQGSLSQISRLVDSLHAGYSGISKCEPGET